MSGPPRINIQSTQGIALRHGVKILVFGPPGSGKTRLCATLKDAFIISVENGMLPLSHLNLPFTEIRNLADFDGVYNWMSNSREARQFASFAIDSLSEIAEKILAFHQGKTRDGRAAYGDTQKEVTELIKKYRMFSGPNIYFSAKQEFIKNDGGNPPIFYGPMLPGTKLAQSTPYDFDEVFQLVPGRHNETGRPFSALRTRGEHAADIVKDRSGKLADWEMPEQGSDLPSLGRIIAKITA